MKIFIFSLAIGMLIACDSAQIENKTALTEKQLLSQKDTIEKVSKPKEYQEIKYLKEETLNAASGTKSVLFNPKGDKIYALNLEGMSVSEYDQQSRQLLREFTFKATPGTGWDYDTDKPIKSYEEKPVEAAFSHNGSVLWVSLHNAEGLVPIHLKADAMSKSKQQDSDKEVYIQYANNTKTDTVYVPIIKTGKTPKVIATSSDNKNLLVSNWHSYSVSVLDISSERYPYGVLVKNINVDAIPRGVVIDDVNQKSYIAIMGGARINVVHNRTWESLPPIQVASNPRHILKDDQGRLYVSFNKLGQVACIDAKSGKTLFKANTKSQPRTIQLSKNNKFLFVTCYKGNTLDVFKIHDDRFELKYSLPCKGSPVGVDIFENDEILEAWVCNYTLGNIKVLEFNKK